MKSRRIFYSPIKALVLLFQYLMTCKFLVKYHFCAEAHKIPSCARLRKAAANTAKVFYIFDVMFDNNTSQSNFMTSSHRDWHVAMWLGGFMGRDLSENEKICLSSSPMLLINHPLSLIKILVSDVTDNGGRTKITKIDKQSAGSAKAFSRLSIYLNSSSIRGRQEEVEKICAWFMALFEGEKTSSRIICSLD